MSVLQTCYESILTLMGKRALSDKTIGVLTQYLVNKSLPAAGVLRRIFCPGLVDCPKNKELA